jgi:hypothetical protein
MFFQILSPLKRRCPEVLFQRDVWGEESVVPSADYHPVRMMTGSTSRPLPSTVTKPIAKVCIRANFVTHITHSPTLIWPERSLDQNCVARSLHFLFCSSILGRFLLVWSSHRTRNPTTFPSSVYCILLCFNKHFISDLKSGPPGLVLPIPFPKLK